MPALLPIVAGISAAISAVAVGIAATIATIISTIATVAAYIASKMMPIISAIWRFVTTVIIPVMTVIINSIATAIGRVVSVVIRAFTIVISQAWAIGVQAWFLVSSVVGSIRGLISSILGVIGNILTPILSFISQAITSIATFISTIISKFKEFYSVIKAGIIGKLVEFIKGVADFISFIHTIATATQSFYEGKYAKGVFILALSFDEKLAKDVKSIRETIDLSISSVLKDVNSVFTMFRRDITSVYGYSQYLERILRDIGEGFGIKELENVADKLKEFNKETLMTMRKWVDTMRTEVLDWTTDQLHPIIHILRQIRMTEREWAEYQRLYNYLGLIPLVSAYPSIPKPRSYLLPRFPRR